MNERKKGRMNEWMNEYYLENMFSNTFKERYLNFSFGQINKIYEHFDLRQKIYNLSAISSLCIKSFKNVISLILIIYF